MGTDPISGTLRAVRSAFPIAAALLLCVPLAAAEDALDWVDIEDPAELHALHANKTFRGKDDRDRPWVVHYRADGRGVMLFDGGRYRRSWEINGKDHVCVNTQFDRRCFRFQRHASKPATYRQINVGNDEATEFTVEDGTPGF
jgi:hypothetical protein